MYDTIITALVLSAIVYIVYRHFSQKYARIGLVMTFDGTGYVTFGAGSEYNVKRTNFTMDIKTTFPTGILMYAKAQDDDYFVTNLADGHVVCEFDMGSGPFRLRSYKTVNDGMWHRVSVDRYEKIVYLTVDDEKIVSGSDTANLHISRPSIVYVGGNALDDHTKFKGCMRNIRFNDRYDIQYDFTTGGVTLGCQ